MRKNTINDVLRRLEVDHATGCHNWTGLLDKKGYGVVNYNGKKRKVHRVIYELHHGDIPIGLETNHLCENKRCANRKHLEICTPSENQIYSKRTTHCIRGHIYTPIDWTPDGRRNCLTCKNAADRARRNKTTIELELSRADI